SLREVTDAFPDFAGMRFQGEVASVEEANNRARIVTLARRGSRQSSGPSMKSEKTPSGAPGRTRTSTMFPPPDFESGASTNSATGAWGVDNSRGAGRVNAEMPLFAGRQFHGEPLCGREGARMAGAPARKSGR